MIQTIYVSNTEDHILYIKHYVDNVLTEEIFTQVGSEEALAIGRLIEEYMKKGSNHYRFDISNDYETGIHTLED